MEIMKKLLYTLLLLFALSTVTTSCREQKSTGDKIEDAIDDVGDAIDDAADDVGDAIDDATK